MDTGSLSSDDDGECEHIPVATQSKPQLRSRPPIDFSRRPLNASSDLNYSAFSQPHSYVSGSTLHSGIKPPAASIPLRRASLDFYPSSVIPPEVIASLTISDLHHNPHYRELRQRYDHVTAVLATYVEQRLASASHVATCNTLVPHMPQGVPCFASG